MDIRIEHLTKRFGQQIAVNDISFTVKEGEVVGFLGPNGAGKTTTMNMICGLIRPDTGHVLVGGIDVAKAPITVRRSIGHLPEMNPLYEDMAVLDLLRFGAALQGLPRGSIDARIREMVEVCGLGDEKHKRIGELSRGYRQRAGLALAMVHDPQVLILDEPTTGLDPNQIVEVRALIKELGKAKTVIFSTHILPEVEAVCERVVIINKGRVVAEGAPAQLRARMGGAEVVLVRITGTEPENILTILRATTGITSATPVPAEKNLYEVLLAVPAGTGTQLLYSLCVERKWSLGELRPLEVRLEDVFRDVTLN